MTQSSWPKSEDSGKRYVSDGKIVFHDGIKVEAADPGSFEVLAAVVPERKKRAVVPAGHASDIAFHDSHNIETIVRQAME